MQSIDLASGGSASFPFQSVGDSVTGKILNLEELQQTDLQTGEVKTFTNGQPMMMYRVELQTNLRDGEMDDGVRSVYLKGSKKPESHSSLAAVLQAVLTATGRAALTVGGTLTLTYTGDGVAKGRGFSAPKQYSAQYAAPSVSLDPQPAAAPQAPAPVPPTPAAPASPWGNQPAAPASPWGNQPAAPASPWGNQPAAPQAPAPATPATPAPAAPSGLTPEQIAALKAAGIDPATLGA